MRHMRHLPILAVTALIGCNSTGLDSYTSGVTGGQGGTTTDGNDIAGTTSGIDPDPTPTASDGGDSNQTNPNQSATPTPTPSPAVFNCNTTLYPVCDGFELVAVGSAPDGNRWDSNVTLPPPGDSAVHTVHPTQDSILVSDKYAHTGKHSLHFHTVGDWEHLPIQNITSAAFPHAFFPAPNNTFFVRYWVYHEVANGETNFDSGGHWYMVNASGPLAGRQQYQKFGGGGTNLGWNYFGNDDGIGSSMAWPIGAWHCFETEFKGDTAELHVWHNDTPVNDMTSAAGHWAAPAYNRLTIGWEMDHPAGNYAGADVYIDDVVFAYSRIKCPVTTP